MHTNTKVSFIYQLESDCLTLNINTGAAVNSVARALLWIVCLRVV